MSYLILSGVIIIVFFPSNAYAYINPGAGSSVIQIVIVILVSGLFLIKLFCRRIKGFFIKLFVKIKKNYS